MALIEQAERDIEGVHHVLLLAHGGIGPLAGLRLLGLDALLLGCQDLGRDGVAVVELDELLLLGIVSKTSPGTMLT